MQATIATYDSTTGDGTLLFDDGVRMPFGAGALVGSHIRHLRSGQRVIVELDQAAIEAPTVMSVRIH